MRKPDTTGCRVATLAAEILGARIAPDQTIPLRRKKGPPFLTTGEYILLICASTVNQAADHDTGKPETTSKRVAKIAGRVLGTKLSHAYGIQPTFEPSMLVMVDIGRKSKWVRFTWAEIVAMAGSLVNQSPDHADRATLRAGKLPRGHRRVKVHKPVLRRLNHD